MSKEGRGKVTRYLLLSARKESSKISAAELVEMNKILTELGISHDEALKSATQIMGRQFE
jgi:hypothetical protein